jgi:RNA polymerase sigma-70 factor (ECF subfamily)
MSAWLLDMTLRESGISGAQILARALHRASDDSCSDAEIEVIRLFDEYRNRLLRYILCFGLSVHDGEEIVQDVFLSLFRHLQRGRPQDNLRGWLFRVAHNLALKARQASHTRLDSEELSDAIAGRQIDPSPGPEQLLASSQRQQWLLAVVHALPVRDQYCLQLRAEGLRYREIAEVLGMSLGAVSISLTRSIARLARADREVI